MAVRVEDYAGKVTVSDGAWGTELDKLGCPPGFCREEWNLTKPELVGKVAAAYVNAGSQIILTNTFSANRFALARHGKAEQVAAYNKAGAAISKKAAGTKAKVFGSIGPSGKMLMDGDITEDDLLAAFKDQAQALAEGGCDALVVETMTDLQEAAIAVRAAKTTGLLVVGCMTYDSGPDHTRTMMGVTPEQAVEGLTDAGVDIIGCNCGIGIDNYIVVAGKFRAATKKPVWVKANAGMPEVVNGKPVYKMQPEVFGERVKELIKAGADIVGGCCGTSPAFIAATAKALARK
jgi:5-methyltetrahydrofolate--homocysteine methyltransferase